MVQTTAEPEPEPEPEAVKTDVVAAATAEAAVEPAAETAAASAPAASKPQGITADGRAANDPRVAPRPVAQVEIATDHPILFREQQYPPVQGGGGNAPRASNDPRGPRSGAMREAAEG
tara:strand:- start:48 stop:401 length:354 start_codon:yes stop_codon:yes gene_type:complete